MRKLSMEWNTLATTLFGAEHGIRQDDDFLHGTVTFDKDLAAHPSFVVL